MRFIKYTVGSESQHIIIHISTRFVQLKLVNGHSITKGCEGVIVYHMNARGARLDEQIKGVNDRHALGLYRTVR